MRAIPEVTLIARTEFLAPEAAKVMDDFRSDAEGGQALIEAAGRACYQSFSKPNPTTASNQGYLKHIIDVNHGSVLEHASATFYITGVSRSFTHELVRHRHLNYSQLSQRFVQSGDANYVEPGIIMADKELSQVFHDAMASAQYTYRHLLQRLDEIFAEHPDSTGRRKLARQAARAVLPNATETKIVVSGNYRAWRHFIEMRGSVHADTEIRHIAVTILRALREEAPNVFSDFTITRENGVEVAVREE